MAIVTLIQASPRLPSGGTLLVRLAGGGSRAYTQLGVNDWRGGIANKPRFTTAIAFDKGGPTGGAIPQTAGIRIAPSDKAYFSALSNVVWPGARVTIATGNDEDAAPNYITTLKGTVADAKTTGASITLTIADLSADLNKVAAPNTFAGIGGLEGGDSATGRIKRRTFGTVFNVEGLVLDPANNVYEFGDPAFGLSSFDMLKDKGQSGPMTVLAWQGSALATLNALKAATVTKGGGVVAPSISCAKWWTIPAGPITADLTYTPAEGLTPAGLAAVIAQAFAPEMTIANLADAKGWVNAAAGVHIDDASETVGSVLDRLLLPVFIAWVLRGDGALIFRQISFANPVASLRAETIERETVFPALKTRKLGFQRNYRKHSEGEISEALLTATDIAYADGTPIEVLKPMEAGANVTEARTAAAITGQGAFATTSTAAYGSPLLTGFGQLSPLNNVYFGSPYLLEGSGLAQATLAAFKTIQGIAASITGQGGFATINSAAYGSSFLTGFGALSPLSELFFGAPLLRESSGGASATLGNFKTIQGIAASITGQGAFATTNSAAYGSSLLTGFGALSPLSAINFGSAFLLEAAGGAQATAANFKTSLGNAAGFAGQGTLATKDNVFLGTQSGRSYGLLTENGLGTSDASLITAQGVASAISGQGGFATISSAAYGSSFLTGFGALAPLAQINLGQSYIRRADGSTVLTDALAVTSLGTAAAITGQTVFATLAAGTTLDNAAFGMPTRLGNVGGFLSAANVQYQGGPAKATIESLRPAEAGSNVTETRTAAAFTGQGTLATRSYTTLGDGTAVSSGGFILTDSNTITANGTAAAFTGQTAFATLASGTSLDNAIFGLPTRLANFGGFLSAANMQYQGGAGTVAVSTLRPGEAGSNVTETRTSAAFTGQGMMATKDYVKMGSADGRGAALITENGFGTTDAGLITAQGVSSAFAGQGALATRANITYGDGYTFGFNYLATLSQVTFNTTTIKRADGTTTVSETMVVTEQGIAAAFAGQGGLATKDQAGYPEINVATMTSTSNDTTTGTFGGPGNDATALAYVPNFGKDLAIKSGGTVYASISCGSLGSSNLSLYNSLEILDASNNAVLGSVKIPFHTGSNYLVNYIVMVPNTWGTRSIRWRLAWRGSAGQGQAGATGIIDPTVTVQWKAL